MRIVTAPEIRTRKVVTTRPFQDCEDCGAEHQGRNGIHWTSTDQEVGLVYVCGGRCLQEALGHALDTSPVGSTITVEHEVHEQPMEVAA